MPFDNSIYDCYKFGVKVNKFDWIKEQNKNYELSNKKLTLMRFKTMAENNKIDLIEDIIKSSSLKKLGVTPLNMAEFYFDYKKYDLAAKYIKLVTQQEYFDYKIEMLKYMEKYEDVLEVAFSCKNMEKIPDIVNDILKRIPENIDYDYTYKLVQFEMSPTDVVLLQEIIRYNNLLNEMRVSLNELLNGIKGIVVMSPELEEMYNYILDGRVPKLWSSFYQSLQPLAGWTRDLILRIEFFDEWSKGTIPKIFWLGAFIFPVGFLTALLQKTSRKNNIPIDVLGWEFIVQQVDDENHITQEPKEGAYIKNIFLEGASWDKKNNCLTEPIPMELLTPMPPIHFKPIESKKKQAKGNYTCPLYYYSIRTGTRERPSFVIAMELKSGSHDSDFWVKRGTAALLSPK